MNYPPTPFNIVIGSGADMEQLLVVGRVNPLSPRRERFMVWLNLKTRKALRLR